MTARTRASTLLLLAVIGGVTVWASESWLVGTGRAVLVPPLTLAATLLLIAALALALAWPIRRYTRELRRRAEHGVGRRAAEQGDGESAEARRRSAEAASTVPRVPPLHAVRVLALAKACSLSGSLLGGGAAAVVLFLLTRPVLAESLLPAALAAFGAAAVLVAAGLVAESWCALPPGGGAEPSASVA